MAYFWGRGVVIHAGVRSGERGGGYVLMLGSSGDLLCISVIVVVW